MQNNDGHEMNREYAAASSSTVESGPEEQNQSGVASETPSFNFLEPYQLSSEITLVPETVSKKVKDSFTCPFSSDLFFDPVQTSEGDLFERVELETYLALNKDNPICPLTREPLAADKLTKVARPLMNEYMDLLRQYPQLWHDVYIPNSYRQALSEACYQQGTVQLELQVRKHGLALTHIMLDNNRLLIEVLCDDKANTGELLPWVIAQLKPEQWQALVCQRSVQDWLQTIATVVARAESVAVSFVNALVAALKLNFEPRAFLAYACQIKNNDLIRLALAYAPELIKEIDVEGNGLLHRAVLDNNKELVSMLLQRDDVSRSKNNDGNKPRTLAASNPELTHLFSVDKFKRSFQRLSAMQQQQFYQQIINEANKPTEALTNLGDENTDTSALILDVSLDFFEAFERPYQLPPLLTPTIVPDFLIAKNTNQIAFDPMLDGISQTYEHLGRHVPGHIRNEPLKKAIQAYLSEHPELYPLQHFPDGPPTKFVDKANILKQNLLDISGSHHSTDKKTLMLEKACNELRELLLTNQQADPRFMALQEFAWVSIAHVSSTIMKTLPELILGEPLLLPVLLPTWLQLVRVSDWQTMLRRHPLEHWLVLFANVVQHSAPLAIQAVRQMQQALGLRFNPLAFIGYAARRGDARLLQLAITCYPELINTPIAKKANTLLHIAVQLKDARKVTFLVNSGADVDIKNSDGVKPCNMADPASEIFHILHKAKAQKLYDRLTPEVKTDMREWMQASFLQSSSHWRGGASSAHAASSSSSSSLQGQSVSSSSSMFSPVSPLASLPRVTASVSLPSSRAATAPGLYSPSVASASTRGQTPSALTPTNWSRSSGSSSGAASSSSSSQRGLR